MQPPRIALIGFMGSGKTVVGAQVATLSGMAHRDTDALLEAKYGATVAELFAREGESWFRDREGEVLELVSPEPNIVVSTGGGIVLRPSNRLILESLYTVWLTTGVETLVRRLENEAESRPLLQSGDLHTHILRMLAERAPLYQQAAHIVVDTTNREPHAIAREIWRKAERRGQSA